MSDIINQFTGFYRDTSNFKSKPIKNRDISTNISVGFGADTPTANVHARGSYSLGASSTVIMYGPNTMRIFSPIQVGDKFILSEEPTVIREITFVQATGFAANFDIATTSTGVLSRTDLIPKNLIFADDGTQDFFKVDGFGSIDAEASDFKMRNTSFLPNGESKRILVIDDMDKIKVIEDSQIVNRISQSKISIGETFWSSEVDSIDNSEQDIIRGTYTRKFENSIVEIQIFVNAYPRARSFESGNKYMQCSGYINMTGGNDSENNILIQNYVNSYHSNLLAEFYTNQQPVTVTLMDTSNTTTVDYLATFRVTSGQGNIVDFWIRGGTVRIKETEANYE